MRRRMMVLVGIVVASLLVSTSAVAAPATAAPGWGAPGYHMVRAGETLSSIARRYGVSAWAIASANHLANPNRIYAGQWLQIPHGYYPPPGGHWGGRVHWVRHGETMLSIGRLYGMNPWVIASANGIYNLNQIYAGQRLVIPRHV